jgi:hypothetical protein
MPKATVIASSAPFHRELQHAQTRVHAQQDAAGAPQSPERDTAAGAQVEHDARGIRDGAPHGRPPGAVLPQRHHRVEQVVAAGDVVEHAGHLTDRVIAGRREDAQSGRFRIGFGGHGREVRHGRRERWYARQDLNL